MQRVDDVVDTKITFLQLVGTVLSAAFGVQSSKNRERDFSFGKARTFAISGIIFSVLFIVTLSSIVHLVLTLARP